MLYYYSKGTYRKQAYHELYKVEKYNANVLKIEYFIPQSRLGQKAKTHNSTLLHLDNTSFANKIKRDGMVKIDRKEFNKILDEGVDY